jgi:hypothetical protein
MVEKVASKMPDVEHCRRCGREIKVMAFRGTGLCSIDCRKALGLDPSSSGTIMFVTKKEHKRILKKRKKKSDG